MSTCTDVAMHAAGIMLMRGDPALIADAIEIQAHVREDPSESVLSVRVPRGRDPLGRIWPVESHGGRSCDGPE